MSDSAFFTCLELAHGPGPARVEDTVTELVAAWARSEVGAFGCFLEALGIHAPLTSEDRLRVQTQVRLPRLDGHASESIPDLVLSWTSRGRACLAFVECKVDALEGQGQLDRYADHLMAQTADSRWLVFLTKRHVDRDRPAGLSDAAGFLQSRWAGVYRGLAGFAPRDLYLTHLLGLLEKLGMDEPSRFTSLDCATLMGLDRSLRPFDVCLEGVEPHFKDAFGLRKNWWLANFPKRRCLQNSDNELIDVGVGFNFTEIDPLVPGFPDLWAFLGGWWGTPEQRAVIGRFVDKVVQDQPGGVGNTGWRRYKDGTGPNPYLERVCSLASFVAAPNAVQDAQAWLRGVIEELAHMKTELSGELGV